MKKVTTLVLMLCLVLSGALCYAHGVVRTENGKGEGAILTKQKAHHVIKAEALLLQLMGMC